MARVTRRAGAARDGSTLDVSRAAITLGADGRRSRLGEACGLSRCAAAPQAVGDRRLLRRRRRTLDARRDARARRPLPWRRPDRATAAPTPASCSRMRRGQRPGVIARRAARLAAAGRSRARSPVRRAPSPRRRPSCWARSPIDTRMPGCAGLLLDRRRRGLHRPDDRRRHPPRARERGDRRGHGDRRAARPASQPRWRTVVRHGSSEPRLGRKRAFNRVMRTLVASPRAVALAARGAAMWPAPLRAAIRYAGDASAAHA